MSKRLMVLTLERPITVGGKRLREIELRRPSAAARARFHRAHSNVGKANCAIEALTLLSREQILELDLADFGVLSEALIGFLEDFAGRLGNDWQDRGGHGSPCTARRKD